MKLARRFVKIVAETPSNAIPVCKIERGFNGNPINDSEKCSRQKCKNRSDMPVLSVNMQETGRAQRIIERVLRWRREGGIRTLAAVIPPYSLSRGAPSASWVLLHVYFRWFGGERGIRTPRCLSSTSLVFKTSALNRSAISRMKTVLIIIAGNPPFVNASCEKTAAILRDCNTNCSKGRARP